MDPISDMLTRIRNAQAVGNPTVGFPFSKIKFELIKLLNKERLVGSISKKRKGNQRKIEVILKYKDEKGKIPVIQRLKRVSKSGQRIYIRKKELGKTLRQRGTTILSTSQGLMTAQEAKRKNIGGEVICKVW